MTRVTRQEEQKAQFTRIKIMESQGENFRNHQCLSWMQRTPMQIGVRYVEPGCEDCHAQWRPRGMSESTMN